MLGAEPPHVASNQYCSARRLLRGNNRGCKGPSQVAVSLEPVFCRRFDRGAGSRDGRRAQHRTPRPTGMMQSRAALTILLFGRCQSLQVSLHLALGGPTHQVELQHLERPLGWLPAGPEGN